MNFLRSPRELGRRALEHLARPHAGVLHRREAAGVDGLGHQRAGHAQVERQLAHPLAGALGAGRVEDHVDQVAAGLGVLDAEDVAGDLDQVAVQLAAVPLGEDVVQLVVRQAQGVLEHPK